MLTQDDGVCERICHWSVENKGKWYREKHKEIVRIFVGADGVEEYGPTDGNKSKQQYDKPNSSQMQCGPWTRSINDDSSWGRRA